MTTRTLERIGGAALVVGSLGFLAAFGYLGSTFDYPDVLDRRADEVLPALAAGGTSLRVAWLLYGAIPLTLLVAGIASMSVLERGAGRGLARFGGAFAALASVAMMIGLLRWPSIQWTLAERWVGASEEQREVYAAVFDSANVYLGNIFGEFLGETMLAAWFVTLGVALRRTGRRRVGWAALAMGAVTAVSAVRLITTAVDPVSAINNVLLPLWLVALGVVLWRGDRSLATAQRQASASPPLAILQHGRFVPEQGA
jgi:hypothetical protein